MISAPSPINTEGYRSGHNEAVLKTVWVYAHVGSNPTPSAIADPQFQCYGIAGFIFFYILLTSIAVSVIINSTSIVVD